jgi:hypothetical protein
MVPVKVTYFSFRFETFTVSQAFDLESLSSTDQSNFLIETLLRIRNKQFGLIRNPICKRIDQFYLTTDCDQKDGFYFFNVLDYKKHIVPLSGDSSLVLYSLCLLQNNGFTRINKEQNIFEVRVDFINFIRRPNVLPGLEENVYFDSSERIDIYFYLKGYFYQNKARLMDDVIKALHLVGLHFDIDDFKRAF